MDSNPIIRRLEAGDAPDASRLHIAAFPGFFMAQLGSRVLAEFYRSHVVSPAEAGLVAVSSDGKLQGAVLATRNPTGYYSRMLRVNMRGLGGALIASWTRNPRDFYDLLRRLSSARERHTEGVDAVLTSICVAPHARGAGIGKHLVTALEAELARAGVHLISLSTDAMANEPVNRFYASQGWSLVRRYAAPGGRQMNEYVKSLTDAQPRDTPNT